LIRLKGFGAGGAENAATQTRGDVAMAEALSYRSGRAHVRAARLAADASKRAVAWWLLVCAALVAAMVLVGGVTRLTHSGLSIVEWQPLVGAIPPLNEAQWQEVFEKYKQTPEYKLVNFGMSLEAFKGIFFWEYVHRLLGRLIGLAFLVPLVWFWLRGRLDRPLAWKLVGVFLLGGLQGALGWYMVQSGLVDDPRVSHFRLTAHLGLAFLIFGAMLWIALDLLHPRRTAPAAAPSRLAGWVAALVFGQVLLGGLVAGIRAGKAYNTFPLMDGRIVPPEIFMIEPWWKNFFYNMATVQFDHRLMAWLLLALVAWLWWRTIRAAPGARARLAAHLLAILFVAQFALGVWTLLLQVPVALGAAHQFVAVLVFGAALACAHALRKP
jgi:cytochrome c oxidase assembly protein subunit 15